MQFNFIHTITRSFILQKSLIDIKYIKKENNYIIELIQLPFIITKQNKVEINLTFEDTFKSTRMIYIVHLKISRNAFHYYKQK